MLEQQAEAARLEVGVSSAYLAELVVRVKLKLETLENVTRLTPFEIYHLQGNERRAEVIRLLPWYFDLEPHWLEEQPAGLQGPPTVRNACWQHVVTFYQTQNCQLFRKLPWLPDEKLVMHSELRIHPLDLKVRWKTRRRIEAYTVEAAATP